MKATDQLKGLFSLDHNLRLYIPSTVDTDQPALEEQAAAVTAALTLFSQCFGGSTAYDALGAWSSPAAGLVTEAVKIVEAYATREQVEEHLQTVLAFGQQLKKDMAQEAIAFEYDNKLYFI
jgi:hypothetical protein